MTVMTVRNLLIILSSALLAACSSQTRYSSFQPVPLMGWDADSVLTYDIRVTDNTPCDILLCVRHTESYPYQNMWLFCSLGRPDTTALWTDTLEFYLADDRGRWLGNGSVKLIEMPVIFAQNYQFPDTGRYVFRIQQGMRDKELRGVSDVGVIIRNGKE